MATLIKQRGWYYLQFYDGKRMPQRKRIPLKTRTLKTAEFLRRNYEDKYAIGDFDPWTGVHNSSSRISIDENTTVEEALAYFIEKKSREDWRENTIINTSYVLKAFCRFLGGDRSVRSLTPTAINSFLNQDKFGYETKKSHKAKIKGFANWLVKYKVVKYDYSEIKIYNRNEEQNETVSYLSLEEIEKLKEGIKSRVEADIKKGYQSKSRNSLWLVDFIDWQRLSGMRISETLNLYPSDINTDTWEVRIGSNSFSTKAKRKQILPIGNVNRLVEIAKKRLKQVPSNKHRLFQHKDRRRTSRTFKKYVRLILPGREDVTVHSLRHTCCIELLRRNVPIYTVQRWMRHSNIRTTELYADLLANDISKAVGAAFNE